MDAAAFGFEDIPDKYNARGVPDQSRLSRAKNGDRFSPDEYERIERRAKRIIELVHEQGNPMGLQSLQAEDKRDASPPTKHRHAKSKRNEAAGDAAKMAAGVNDFMRENGTTYDMETFLRVLAEMSVDGKTARGGACRDDDEPLECENLKSAGDTFRYYPNSLHPTDLVRIHNKVAQLLSRKIKKNVEFEEFLETVESFLLHPG